MGRSYTGCKSVPDTAESGMAMAHLWAGMRAASGCTTDETETKFLSRGLESGPRFAGLDFTLRFCSGHGSPASTVGILGIPERTMMPIDQWYIFV